MKLSEYWIREWVDVPLNAAQLAEQLTMAGLEIESVTPVAGDFKKVFIGEVIDVVAHPNAEKLRVCQVNIGQNESLTIVCGAANVRKDLRVPLALVGAEIQGKTIQASKLRDVMSHGMICSSAELGLEEVSNGVMELPDDAPIGKDIREWLQLNDTCLDLHITPNRGDCLSVQGLAREIAALNNTILKPRNLKTINTIIQQHQLEIKNSAPEACPRYLGRVIRGINSQAKIPLEMAERLRRSGLRCIHPVVDILNYVMLELGQPLHAFDCKKINGAIQIRMAQNKEKIELLNNQTVELAADMLVIADDKQAHAIAGIMGGLHSSVTENTQDIFIESAFFAPQAIAGRARRLGLNTDASYRFERGVNFELPEQALNRVTQLLVEIVGGEAGPMTEKVEVNHLPKLPKIELQKNKIEKILGMTVPENEVTQLLMKLGMQVEQQANAWLVTPPGYRFDISLPEDLIEEIIRVRGYDTIPVKQGQTALTVKAISETQLPTSRIKKLLVDRGYNEAITYSFVSEKLQQMFDPDMQALALKNPISNELAVMRTSLWPGLVSALLYNQNRQQQRVRLFETGLRFVQVGNELIQQPTIAGIICGEALPEQWATATKQVDFFDCKGDVEALLQLSQQEFTFKKITHSACHPGQTAGIFQQDKLIGKCGALHPAIQQQLDIVNSVFLFELDLHTISKAQLPVCKNPSKFPAIRRDISFWINDKIEAQQLYDVARQQAGELLQDIFLFDLYVDKKANPPTRSMALAMWLQHPERTLVDEEINAVMSKVITALENDCAIRLRD